MTSGLPSRVAICAVLVTAQLASVAHADEPVLPDPTQLGTSSERRQVAVIDLSEDAKVTTLSGDIYKVINQSDTLMIPNKRGLDGYLTGKLYDEDAEPIRLATVDHDNAQGELDEAKPTDAVRDARSGLTRLTKVVPTSEVVGLGADLALLLGLAELDLGKPADAANHLALSHRLDPSRRLDPARYPPDVVAAYKRAADSHVPAVKLEVKGTGTVWIDGVERGRSPATFDVEPGEHLVAITGAERISDGQIVSAPATAIFPDAPASEMTQVYRARLALSRAQAQSDDVARAGAMKRLAALLGVGDVVMISKRINGQLQWETWRDRAPGFSAPKTYRNDQKPEEILEGLGPLHRPQPRFSGPPPFVGPPIAIEKPWYQEGWVQLSIFGTVAALAVGAILLSRIDQPQMYNIDVKPAM